MKVLILTCGTGEGHNSAANALKLHLDRAQIQCTIADPLSFKSKKTSERAASMYSTIISKTPWFFGLIYVIGKVYDDMRLPSPVLWYNSRYAKQLHKYIADEQFTHVVCTHLFAMQAMTAVRKKFQLSIPCYGVLTDYSTIPFYKDTKLDGYFVATEFVKSQLVKKRISPDIIKCTGIPVNPKFLADISREQAREDFDIPTDKKVVMIMSGGAGCGKIKKLCTKLDKRTGGDDVIFVFPGKNVKLQQKLEKKFSDKPNVRIVPFTPDVNVYLKCADVVVSKPGGLSSTEIAVTNVPLVHTRAIPGMEIINKRYFKENGLSLAASTTTQIVNAVIALLTDERLSASERECQKRVIPTDAAERIISTVLEL